MSDGRAHPAPPPPPDDFDPAAAPLAPGRDPTPPKHPMLELLWPMLHPHRWLLLLAIGLNAFYGIAITFQTLIPKYIIDNVLLIEDGSQVSLTQRYWRLGYLAAAFLAVALFGRMLTWHLSYRMFAHVRERLLFSLRQAFFRHVNHLCLRFHRRTHSGELFSYLFGSPLGQITGFYNHAAMAVPGAAFTLITTLAWVSLWDPWLTLVLAASVAATVALMQNVQRRIRTLHTGYQETEGTVSGEVADLLRGTRDVKLLAVEERVAQRFEEQAHRIGQQSYQRDVRTHLQLMKHEAAGYFCFAAIFIVGSVRYLQNAVTIGEFQAYLTAFLTLQGPLGAIFTLFVNKAGADAGLARLDTVLRTASSTPDPIGYEAEPPPRADILLYDVHFAYDPDRPVLRGLDLRIPYGQHVAFVGPSGSGKTTLAQLLLRMYDPDSGAILFGGLNIRHCRGTVLRSRFGVVPQDPFLFRASIRENLLVANPNADDAMLEDAARRANAWDFISQLDSGLDTSLGESGNTLSGGQKQRLAITRALLRDPDYFIFDEATSALDTVSEGLIQEAIERAWQGRTAILIAHRLSTIKTCDRIVVMKDGRVAQDGTYDELVSTQGLFRDLVEGQQLEITA